MDGFQLGGSGGPDAALADVAVVRAGGADYRDLATLRWDWQLAQGEVPEMSAEEFGDRFVAWASERSRTHLAFVARRDAAAVGMAWLAVTERLPGPGRWDRANGYIATLYVDPGERGGGIGSALISALIDASKERGIDVLQVHPSDQAMSLYRRFGFDERRGSLELGLS